MPRVSVVLPTYNRSTVIGRAIKSVLEQTYVDFELIVVDDGSTDSTLNVLDRYDPSRVRVITLKKNSGPCRARNIGISAAQGELIAFHDSDDEWLPNKLALQLDKLTHPQQESHRQVGAVYSRVISKSGGVFRLYFPPYDDSLTFRGDIYRQLLQRNVVGTPTMIVKRDVLNRVGLFDEELTWLEDWDLALRIAQRFDFEFVPQPLIITNWSLTGVNARNDAKSMYRLLAKHLDAYATEFSEVGAEAFWMVGDKLMKDGYSRLGRISLKNALKLSPKPHIALALLASAGGSNAYTILSQVFSYSGKLSRLWHSQSNRTTGTS